MVLVQHWAVPEEFKPNSSKQMLGYFAAKGYKIRTNRKTKKPTVDEEAIRDTLLEHDDPVLEAALSIRKLKRGAGDLKDTHVRGGRFHSTYPLEPDTGRLASRGPNLMNRPQGRDGELDAWLAKLIRSTIVADEGKILLSRDWRAIEAQLVAFFSNDPDYARASELDSHGLYTSHILAWQKKLPSPFSVSDPDIGSKLEWLKKTYPTERAMGKKINLASSYGMGARLLARHLRCSVAEASTFLRIKDEMSPKVTKWKQETQQRAHVEGQLVNPWGFVRPFFAVFERRKDGSWKPGPEANEALSFIPQSSGASMLRDCLVDLDEHPRWQALGGELLVPIHDDILAQAPLETADEAHHLMAEVMEKAWPELGGLVIRTEGKRGRSWAEMGA